MVKNLPAMGENRFNPWVRKSPFRREWQPTPVFLPGEFHGQRSLVGCSPWGHKESDTLSNLCGAWLGPRGQKGHKETFWVARNALDLDLSGAGIKKKIVKLGTDG